MSYELRSYAGGAPETALAIDVTAGALSFAVTTGDGANYPDGSGGDYFAIIDYDKAGSAEKVLIASRSGDTFTVATRGADGTIGTSHSAGAKVRLVWTATEALEANRAAHYTVGQVTSKGDLLVGSGANTLTRLPAGTAGQVLTANPAATDGLDFETFDAIPSTAWTAYTPAVTGSVSDPTFTAGTVLGRYKLLGKTLLFAINVTAGPTAVGSGTYHFALPSGVTTAGFVQVIPCLLFLAGGSSLGRITVNASTYLTVTSGDGTTLVSDSNPPTGLYVTGAVEIA